MKSFRELSVMPWMQFFTSAACNLKCEYCSQAKNHHHAITDDSFTDPHILKMLSEIPPTSFYVSGGEPLIHPGVEDFVKIASEYGHYISFDTNIVTNYNKLEKLLKSWQSCNIGMFNISHHVVENLKLDYILKRSELLRNYGHRVLIKYIGTPDYIDLIEKNVHICRKNGFGTATTLCYGKWRGRTLPLQYTNEEMYRLFDLLTLGSHALQFFRGIPSLGLPCRGGQDFLVYNMNEDKRYIPCCHGTGFEQSLESTFFKTGDSSLKRCKIKECRGDLMMMLGLNNVEDEIDRFDMVLEGNYDFLGAENAIDHLEKIRAKGFKFVNEDHYLSFKKFVDSKVKVIGKSPLQDYYRQRLMGREKTRIEKEKDYFGNSLTLHSDETFKESIFEEIPVLRKAVKNKNYERITDLLREYAFGKLKWSEDGINLNIFASDSIEKLSVSQLTFLLEANEIGLLCGGVAIYLRKLYQLFNLPACTFNYGMKGLMTHVVTLVAVPHQNNYKVILQDAATNSSFKLTSTGDRDFLGIWSKIKAGDFEEISPVEGSESRMTMLFSDTKGGREYLDKCQGIKIIKTTPQHTKSRLLSKPLIYAEGELAYSSSFKRRYDIPVREKLAALNSIPMENTSLQQMMLYPISISITGDEVIDRRLSRIAKFSQTEAVI